jgi:hypothetical protein
MAPLCKNVACTATKIILRENVDYALDLIEMQMSYVIILSLMLGLI